MLSAVHRFPGVPLLGLNLGSLGYLSGVEGPHFDDALHALRDGLYAISTRTALTVRGRTALNEVVVSRGVSGHAAVIELAVEDRPATSFFADGLVIATPTGSTAYSPSRRVRSWSAIRAAFRSVSGCAPGRRCWRSLPTGPHWGL